MASGNHILSLPEKNYLGNLPEKCQNYCKLLGKLPEKKYLSKLPENQSSSQVHVSDKKIRSSQVNKILMYM